MGASLDDAHELHKLVHARYAERLKEQFDQQARAFELFNKMQRKGHTEYGPEPVEERAAYDEWKARFDSVFEEGTRQGWVYVYEGYEGDGGLQFSRPEPQGHFVYDETLEEWRASVNGTVTFPVKKRDES